MKHKHAQKGEHTINVNLNAISQTNNPCEQHLQQQSPTFLAPGTGFMEDGFFMDLGGGSGFGMIQAHTFKFPSCCAAQFLLCWTSTNLWSGGGGPLI